MTKSGVMQDNQIGMIVDEFCEYPTYEYNYSPSEKYPEYPYDDISPLPNHAYEKVRKLFHSLKLDHSHYGLPEWNPLGDFIHPGDTVLVKPNFVLHYNRNRDEGTDCLVTHPSLIRAVLDYVLIATKGQGRVIIGDAPMPECDFNVLMKEKHYDVIWAYYENVGVSIVPRDFRNTTIVDGVSVAQNDALSGVLVDIGKNSALEELSDRQINNFVMVLGSYPDNIKNFHDRGKHNYLISRDVIESNVIIGMPKIKTHRKAGLTACSKNFVGTCAIKDCLPHSIYGGPKVGGCEYPVSSVYTALFSGLKKWQFKHAVNNEYTRKLRRLLYRLSRKHAPENAAHWDGSWYGNDVIWRFIVDLNKAILFSDTNGNLCEEQQRVVFNICDAIVAGQRNGPVSPTPKFLGAVFGGFNGIAIDYFLSVLMGFDYHNIKYIPALLSEFRVNIDDLLVCTDHEEPVPINEFAFLDSWHFTPADGWKDHIEYRT